MRKLVMLCYGVLKNRAEPFRPRLGLKKSRLTTRYLVRRP